ncbi:MAG TPA: carbohydrate-binding domain-containing protein [Abditibacteriaceae bacterium]
MIRKTFFTLITILCAFASAASAARQDVSLNGTWEYLKVKSLDDDAPQNGWQKFEIPGQISGYNYERAWFRRSFDVPAAWQGQKVWLRLGGAKWDSRVLVNGKNAGGTLNGYSAFQLDITPHVRFGTSNEVRIGVRDWTATFSPGSFIDVMPGGSGHGARGIPKNRVIAPFGGHNGNFGIWDDVTLATTPDVYISDYFVRPSVMGKRIEVDVNIKNSGTAAFTSTLDGSIHAYAGGPRDRNGQWPLSRRAPVARFAAQKISIAPGGETKVTLRLNNPPLQVWTPQNPKLYVLNLSVNDAKADAVRERIGYRQIETRGGDFYLNGKKTHLLATSWWPTADHPLSRDEVKKQFKAIQAANTYVFRTHTQPWPRRWYELADEMGILMIPEGALWCDSSVYAVEDERFWKNYGEQLQAMVRHLRNHPSIIMYSLENEMGHCGGKDNPKMEIGMARMARLVKSTDPTRPVTFEADGDPGGAADVIGMHYPNEYPDKRLWPNDAYWMNEPRKLSLWWRNGQPFLWDRSKPLYIGEYLWVYANSSPAAHSIFFGDEAYRNHMEYSARAKGMVWRMQIQAYRHYGVSGQSPWTMIENGKLDNSNPTWLAHRDMYRPLAAFLRDADSRFFAGEIVSRSVELFNDTLQNEPQTKLRWTLISNKKTVAGGERTVNLAAGDHEDATLKIVMPLTAAAQATLRLSLSTPKGEQFREEWPIRVYKRESAWPKMASTVFLFDPPGQVKTLWQKEKMPFKTLAKIESWDGSGVLVIGPQRGAATSVAGSGEQGLQPLAQQNGAAQNGAAQNQDAQQNANTKPQIIGGSGGLRQFLARRVAAGGRVLVLEQGSDANEWLPVQLSDQGSTMAFPQMPSHPVLKGFTKEDLRWWRGDNMVSHHEAVRPAGGAMKPLVVTGSAQGLSHAPLLEVPQGRGAWMICQLRVTSKIGVEPMAHLLLGRLLSYMSEYSDEAPSAAASAGANTDAAVSNAADAPRSTYLVGSDELGAKLTSLGLDWQPLREWNALKYPAAALLILSTDGASIASHAGELKTFMSAGGQVLWHRPRGDSFSVARKALDLPVEFQAYQGPALRADTIKTASLETLTREDLYWLGKAPDVAWSAASLAADVADGAFMEQLKVVNGKTYQATTGAKLDGQYVTANNDGVTFGTNGTATYEVELSSAGRYVLQVTASGTPKDGGYPQVQATLGSTAIGTFYVGGRELHPYNLAFEATAGKHQLTLAFTNDESSATEDRNLFVHSFTLGKREGEAKVEELTNPASLVRYPVGRGSFVLSAIRWDEPGGNGRRASRFISSLLTGMGAQFKSSGYSSAIEAEKLQPNPGQPYFSRQPDHVSMVAPGYIEGAVEIAEGGRYRVTAWGKGTPLDNVYPVIVLNISGKEVGRVELKSDDWSGHTFEADLPQGKHNLRVQFVNDANNAAQDRNLWLDRLEFEKIAAR